jgi:hypothetical protein
MFKLVAGTRPLMSRIAFALVAGLPCLASCGGGASPNAYEQAVAQANAAEAEARALGVPAPCAQASECGILSFLSPTSQCSNWSYAPYSLVSATAAAASSATARQNDLASSAQSLMPGGRIPCPYMPVRPPGAVCIANACGSS